MKKSLFVAMVCAFAAAPSVAQVAAPAAAAVAAPIKGKMLLASGGTRLGSVYRVTADGSPQLIIDGKMVTIPANTLTVENGKLMTSLTKSQVAALN